MARIEPGAGSIPVTGSDTFHVLDELNVVGSIRNPSGSLILSSSAGSEVYVSGALTLLDYSAFDARYTTTASLEDLRYILTSSDTEQRIQSGLVLSGALKIQDDVIAYQSHLILSSSVGSQTTVSGSLHVTGDISVDGTGLSGDVTGSTNFFVDNELDVRGRITNTTDTLILSSSVSTIFASATFNVGRDTTNDYVSIYHDGGSGYMRSFAGNLVLWSADSILLQNDLQPNVGGGARVVVETPSATNPVFTFNADEDTGVGKAAADGLSLIAGGNELMRLEGSGHTILSSSGGSQIVVSGALEVKGAGGVGATIRGGDVLIPGGGVTVQNPGGDINSTASHLVLSSSAGSRVYVSGNFTVKNTSRLEGTVTALGRFIARDVIEDDQSHLILSSSAGSVVRVSGNLYVGLEGADDYVQVFHDGGSGHLRTTSGVLILSPVATTSNVLANGSIACNTANGAKIRYLGQAATTPIYSFLSDEDTGINKGGADQLSLITGGTEKIRIDLTGGLIAPSDHMILSSSGGSQVTVSGAFVISSTATLISGRSPGGAEQFHINSSGIMRLAGGSKIAPGYSYKTNSQSGMYYGANGLGLSVSGKEYLRIGVNGTWSNEEQHTSLSCSAGSVVAISGTLKYGTHTAIGAETVTGYITILDDTGTSRKVAIVS